MTKAFKLLQSTTLIFGQAHQLASCWTDVYKANIRPSVIEYISYLQRKCEI
jgi:hypothetical protein